MLIIDVTVSSMFLSCVAMGILYYYISRVQEERHSWHDTLDRYRIIWRSSIAFAILLLLLFVTILCLFSFGLLDVQSVSNGSAGSSNTAGITSSDRIDLVRTILSVLFVFLIGSIRIFVERAHSENEGPLQGTLALFRSFISPLKLKHSTRNLQVHILRGKDQSVWIWFFTASIAFAIVGYFLPMNAIDLALSETVLMVIVSAVLVTFGFLCWIYMLLFRKLTDEHHFSARSTRIFLGDIFSNEIPRQTVLIGPPAAGKSTFILASPARDATTTAELRTQHVSMPNSRRAALVTLIDCPGENMRDYILLSSAFRADTLILMLKAAWLDVEKLSRTELYVVDRWHELVKAQHKDVKMYLRALHFATHGDAAFDVEGLFRARSFLLYLNEYMGDVSARSQNPGATVLRQLSLEQFRRLAVELGSRFGVQEENCFGVAGNSANANQAVHLLGGEGAIRDRHENWVNQYAN